MRVPLGFVTAAALVIIAAEVGVAAEMGGGTVAEGTVLLVFGLIEWRV